MVYDRGRVKLERSIGGTAASTAMVPGYNRNWPWARVEMKLLPTGKVNAWFYGNKGTRFKSASASVAVPSNWKPAFIARGESGDGYLANLYVGKAEAVTTYYDGLARSMQTRAGPKVTTSSPGRRTTGRASPINCSVPYTGRPRSATSPWLRPPRVAASRRPPTTTTRCCGYQASSRPVTTTPRRSTPDTATGLPSPGRSYVTVDDEKGVATTRVYDAYGRMRHVIADSAGTNVATRNNETSYAHDALDRLTSTTMPGGGTSRYAYDTLGRMVSRHHPDADGATLYKYDDMGRIHFSQDARQRAAGTSNATRKVTYTVYDDFGRVTRVGEAAADFSRLDPERSYPFENDASSWRSRMTYDGGDAVTDSDPVAGNGTASGGSNYAQGRLTRAQ